MTGKTPMDHQVNIFEAALESFIYMTKLRKPVGAEDVVKILKLSL